MFAPPVTTAAPTAHDTAIVTEWCRTLGKKLSSVSESECLARRLIPSGGVSVRGLPLPVRDFPPAAERTPQARVLVLGGIHGDEYSSVSIVFKWMQVLEQFHTGLFHWRVLPLVNPDGLLQAKSQRTNHRGIDLNRNFPTSNWQKESTDYWVRRTGKDPRRYPGEKALSEPEAQWIAREIDQFRPNVIVAVHAPFNLLDFDGGPPLPPERLGPLYLSLLGTYPGSLGRYAGLEKRIPIITIELTHAGIMPPEQEVRKIWTDLVRWVRDNIRDREPGPLLARESTPEPWPPAQKPYQPPPRPQVAPRPVPFQDMLDVEISQKPE
ncbi:MAG: succinylglutamate desuccinylase/aspartoacylase family protein [Magnetococcales bacterium]|nr:succinylglutamate desuccinylase/aspartoacylase family protein [Magnetococcales bacterium]